MRRSVITLAIVLGLYAAGIAASLCLMQDWTARQTVAVVLTGAVVIWYTWETMLLRQVAISQREQNLRPFVLFKGDAHGGYAVENLGATPALGIQIEPVKLHMGDVVLEIIFPSSVPLLRAGETAPLESEVAVNGNKVASVHAAHLDPKYAVIELDIHILYRSIEGKPYHLIQTIAPKETVVKGFREAAG